MRIAHATVVLEGFVTPPGLVVARIELNGGGLVPHKSSLETEGPIQFSARVEEVALAEFLDKKRPGGLSDIAVRITEKAVSIRATKRILLPVPLSVECVVEVAERRRLNIRLIEASAFGAGVTTLAENEIAKANPIFDAADVPVHLEFDRVVPSDGALTIYGELHGPFDASQL